MTAIARRLSSVPVLRVVLTPSGRLATLALLFGLATVKSLGEAISWIPLNVFGYDFLAYYHAGQRFLDGRPLYDASLLAGPYLPVGADIYRYPPPVPLLALPFLPLPEKAAALIWCSLDVALLAAGCLLVIRLVPAAGGQPRGRGAWLCLVLAFLGQHAVAGEWLVGNVDGPIVLLSALVLWGVMRRDTRGDAVAGVAAGVAAMVKVFPLLLIAWLVWERRWRAAAIATATGLVLGLAALPWEGVDAWRQFATSMTLMLPTTNNPESASIVATAAHVVPAAMTQAALLAILVGGLLRHRGCLSRRFALVTLTMLMLSPATWQHYLVLGYPALWIAYATTGWGWVGLGGWFLFWAEPRAFPIVGQVALFVALLFAPVREPARHAIRTPVQAQRGRTRGALTPTTP